MGLGLLAARGLPPCASELFRLSMDGHSCVGNGLQRRRGKELDVRSHHPLSHGRRLARLSHPG